ncbi:uncharacterized protein involved in exopolysaccharide biosynthesis [Hoeflea marina]|uniref:Uncharacterized protein involved in exopolysaccharide biosynthesis n=1 Tax=Hoeflea marina TaxID=274592 RepID=A0A317PM98_9HYPH|nr:uncharacterized protein involved in exopolysaccharide biosynthesis [Hoeflea marina]
MARWMGERGLTRRQQRPLCARADQGRPPPLQPTDRHGPAAAATQAATAPREEALEPEARPAEILQPSDPRRSDAPLIDLASILRTSWAHRGTVAVAVVTCAVLLAGATLLLHKKYSATATIYFDPTQIRVTDDTDKTAALSPVVISTIIDSQSMIILSDNVLFKVVDLLSLDEDPDFTATVGGDAGDARRMAAAKLQSAIDVDRADGAYVTTVKVVSSEAGKAAEIANTVVSVFKDEINAIAVEKYTTANSALGSRLMELGKAAQTAELEVETYRARNDLVEAGGDLISDKRLTALNELLVQAQKATISAKARYEAVSNATLNDGVSGSVAESVGSRTLGDLRSEYTRQTSIVESLASKMGSRHPALMAAQASLESVKAQIREELARAGATAKDQYEQAVNAENDIKKELTVQKALQSTSSPETVKLKELERKATVSSEIYSTALKRVTEIHEEQNLLQSNIRIISAAVPPLKADGPGRTMLLIAGLFGGSLLGLGLGMLLALISDYRGTPRRRGHSVPDEAA